MEYEFIKKKDSSLLNQEHRKDYLKKPLIDIKEIIFYNFLIIGGYMISIKKIVSIKYFLGNIFRYKFGYVQN